MSSAVSATFVDRCWGVGLLSHELMGVPVNRLNGCSPFAITLRRTLRMPWPAECSAAVEDWYTRLLVFASVSEVFGDCQSHP